MERYKVILAYDGTRFQGYQRQAHGTPVVEARTVQNVVETALRKLGWQGKAVLSAGRTDTGVHASGQVIAFDLEWRHSLQALHRAINAHLPPDVAARTITPVLADFHPRYAAVSRCYRYQLFCDPVRQPLDERFAWRVWPAVNLERMQLAAGFLVGCHNFAAFGAPLHAGGSTVRTLFRAGWSQQINGLVFEITGNAFLYHMVRRLVFVQVEIGQGRLEPAVILQYLAGQEKFPQQGLAPAHGLALVEVTFAEQPGMPTGDNNTDIGERIAGRAGESEQVVAANQEPVNGESDCAEDIYTKSG